MIDEFGSLRGVLGACQVAQLRVTGDIATVQQLAAFKSAMLHVTRRRIAEAPCLNSFQKVADYLALRLADQSRETVHVLYLNARHRLLRDESAGIGTIDEAPFYARELIRRCLDLGASGLIIAHNHPSGDTTPSRADLDATRVLAAAGRCLGITLHDHIIIAGAGYTSFRQQGLL